MALPFDRWSDSAGQTAEVGFRRKNMARLRLARTKTQDGLGLSVADDRTLRLGTSARMPSECSNGIRRREGERHLRQQPRVDRSLEGRTVVNRVPIGAGNHNVARAPDGLNSCCASREAYAD